MKGEHPMTRLVAIAGGLMLTGCCQSVADKSVRSLPPDPTFDTIHARLGDPDRITGSGRSFLHYDLKNGQTVTLIVSGKDIIGAQVSKKGTPNQVREDTARKLAGGVATSARDSLISQVRPGMTEAQVLTILKPNALDAGTVYWGGAGARRLYFQISRTDQVWVEMDGGPNGKVREVGKVEPKQPWARHGGDSITVNEGPTTPFTLSSPAPGAGQVR